MPLLDSEETETDVPDEPTVGLIEEAKKVESFPTQLIFALNETPNAYNPE